MSQQKSTRLYWKDALRQVQISLDDETAVARQHKWASAFHQAQADLRSGQDVRAQDVVDQFRGSSGRRYRT